MASREVNILVELELLRSLTSSDFIALAPPPDDRGRSYWKYVLGNGNDKYRQMVIKKVSLGLAGAVLRLGRWVKLDETNPRINQERLHCPVMLAERLQSAAAFPLVTGSSHRILGLLYIGKREQTRFEASEIEAVQDRIHTLTSFIEEKAT
ncbi:GAF domain-containing protein [Paenibacillus planticolens]|uniref:GAF domain-containing protein n=1 Tax=Paenibacillus planticolens TaxID=2654976 RepID=UPI00149162A3|nr:GAF domain-containing protein [Paenibacillus planticolens]